MSDLTEAQRRADDMGEAMEALANAGIPADRETVFACADWLLEWSNAYAPKREREAALWDAAWGLIDKFDLFDAYIARGREQRAAEATE